MAFVWYDGSSYSNVAVSSAWRTGALLSASLTASATTTARLLAVAGGSQLQGGLTASVEVSGALLTGIRLSVSLTATATAGVYSKPPYEMVGYMYATATLSGRLSETVKRGRGVMVPPDVMRVVVDIWDEEQA